MSIYILPTPRLLSASYNLTQLQQFMESRLSRFLHPTTNSLDLSNPFKTMEKTKHEIALHSTTKYDHRAKYHPCTRQSNHCVSEGYLRPDQAAKSVFFEYIDDFKRPTIRSVHERRLKENPLPPSHNITSKKKQQQQSKTVLVPKKTSPTSKSLVNQALAYVDGISISTKSSPSKTRKIPPPHLATKSHIIQGANVELDHRMSRSITKVNILVGELRGVDVEELEMEDDHILSSALPGSPRKYHGPKRQTALEIINRRKKKNKQLKAQMAEDGDPDKDAWAAEEKERKEKRRLGLERRERCTMCCFTYPKGYMKALVIEKSIYKWRMKQKAVRHAKKQIREAIGSLGDGGAATVFRFAAKTEDVPIQLKNSNSTSKVATSQQKQGRSLLASRPKRPSTAVSIRSIQSPRRKQRGRRSTAYNTTQRPSSAAAANATAKSKTRKTTGSTAFSSSAGHFKRAAPGAITYDQFFQAMQQMFGFEIENNSIRSELLHWLDRDRGGDLSFSEFTNLVNVDNGGKGRRSNSEKYSATPGSERTPGLKLESLDETQQELLVVPMRLIHTLYEKKKVCDFCMQILHADAFALDNKTAAPKHPETESETTSSESIGWSPRTLPTTFTTRHNPWGWDDIRDQILKSVVKRRAVTPFETWHEHEKNGRAVKHYLSFNHVPMPKKRGGRQPMLKQETLCSKIRNGDLSLSTASKSIEESLSASMKIGRIQKSSMDDELSKLYHQWKRSGKTLTYYENTGDFKHAEEQFYTVQAKHLNLSLLKKRKAVMATDKDLDEAASKLQAIMRGRKARQAENKKKEEAKKREEVLKKKKRLLLQQENLSNEQIQSAQKLQALIRGRSSRKKNKKSKNKKQINNKRK